MEILFSHLRFAGRYVWSPVVSSLQNKIQQIQQHVLLANKRKDQKANVIFWNIAGRVFPRFYKFTYGFCNFFEILVASLQFSLKL